MCRGPGATIRGAFPVKQRAFRSLNPRVLRLESKACRPGPPVRASSDSHSCPDKSGGSFERNGAFEDDVAVSHLIKRKGRDSISRFGMNMTQPAKRHRRFAHRTRQFRLRKTLRLDSKRRFVFRVTPPETREPLCVDSPTAFASIKSGFLSTERGGHSTGSHFLSIWVSLHAPGCGLR